jgi:mono/diheme cytochrome c family protein
MSRSRSMTFAALPALMLLAASLGSVTGAEAPLLESDILPILTKNCMGCHGGLRKRGGLDLRTVPTMLSGGESGPAIIAGKSHESELWKRIESDEMPKGDDRQKLSRKQKAAIKAWIDAGLPTVSAVQEKIDPLLSSDQEHEPQQVADAIDQHIGRFLAAADMDPVGQSDDAEFLRRLYLDLTGRVPTAEKAMEFLDSQDPNKRGQLVDALLETAEFGQHFGRTWRNWICPPELPSTGNAGTQPHQQARTFGDWIGKKVVAGETFDKITRDILTVQGSINDNPQVIFFGLVGTGGNMTADGTGRAVASLFMGVQLQCAQCHDDPYRDWSQQEHWALAAFFGRSDGDFTKIEIGKGQSTKAGEINITPAAFKNSGTTVMAAYLRSNAAYEAQQIDDLRVPFVDWLTAPENPYFANSFANRLWFQFFSRGIVNPVDDFRALNPPSHPGLMKLLAGEFVASGFDIKHLIRCICNSQAYQRTSWVEANMDEVMRKALTTAFGRMPMKVMTADTLLDSLKMAYGEEKMDLRGGDTINTTGMAATIADELLEFQRRFGTNEEDATDFTHGVAQMLTMINHPRLLTGSTGLDEYFKNSPDATPAETIGWLYLRSLSRRPTVEELAEATEFVAKWEDKSKAYVGVLWMLVNRSEFIFVR